MMGHEAQVTAAFAVGLSSAAGFAVSNALQHQAAGRVPESIHRALGLLLHLVRQRLWLVATAVSFGAMLLHAVALRLGSLALVQPLMLGGVVLAVPLRAALGRKLPTPSELRAVSWTVAGLALLVVFTNPLPSNAPASIPGGVAMVGVCLVAAAAVLAVSSGRSAASALGPRRQAAVLGLGAGLMFGIAAGLLKVIGRTVSESTSPARVGALVAVLVVVGVLGVAMNQRAYQIAPLAFSMPLVNVVDILVAVTFGVVVFGESPAHDPVSLALQGVGLLVTTYGLRRISSLEPSSLPPRMAVREAWS